jgi:hypothetical protein
METARSRSPARLEVADIATRPRTLETAMLEPNAAPSVVVVEAIEIPILHKEVVDPKKDLWLSTADG